MGKTGMELIVQERKEQIEKHGWSLEQDQDYKFEQLAQAAYFCLDQANIKQSGIKTEYFRWPVGWDRHFEQKIRDKSIIGQLTVAGAFLMAENDRLRSIKWNLHIDSIAKRIDKLL